MQARMNCRVDRRKGVNTVFGRISRTGTARNQAPRRPEPTHVVESEFSTSLCRFVLECTCGEHFDTNYIDEALEWRELHLLMAPLADELAGLER